MHPFLHSRIIAADTPILGGVQLRSAVSPWVRFTWQTATVPAFVPSVDSDIIRPATKNESQKVIEVILNSLSMDSAWNDAFMRVEQYLKDSVIRLFSKEAPLCLVIPRGNRFIAASLLDPHREVASQSLHGQLLSGPVVLSEYRNRGFGSLLLHASLSALRERELETVSGVARAGSTQARHVYTKFGSIHELIQLPSTTEIIEESKGLS